MNKKGNWIFSLGLLGLLLITIVIIGMTGTIVYTELTFMFECKEANIYPDHICQSKTKVSCFDDCKDLGKKYFKANTGGFFSNDECFCKDGKESMRIW